VKKLTIIQVMPQPIWFEAKASRPPLFGSPAEVSAQINAAEVEIESTGTCEKTSLPRQASIVSLPDMRDEAIFNLCHIGLIAWQFLA